MAPGTETYAAMEVEEVACPSCGHGGARLLSVQFDRFGVVRCERCRLVRLSPRPTPDAASKLYDEEYYTRGGYEDYVKTFETYRPLFERFFERRLRLVSRFVPRPGRILECGCAHGFQLDWLRRRGWDVVGNEISDHAAACARERFGLNVVAGALDSAALPPASFDVVYMVDILEHLPDIKKAMANVRASIKPGGVLLVQSPYELFHWEKVAQALWNGKRPGTIPPDGVPYHLAFFTPHTLRRMLEVCGFKILKRHSGNYGAIRKRLSPPRVRVPSPLETALRFAYFKLGVQAAARGAARLIKQGSGIIYVASAADASNG